MPPPFIDATNAPRCCGRWVDEFSIMTLFSVQNRAFTVGVRGPAGRRETETSFGLVRFEMSKIRTVFRASVAWGLTVGDRRLRASAKSLATRRLRSSRRETPCGLAQEGTGSAGMLAQ